MIEFADVSVIIPCYKNTSSIECAVASVANQIVCPKEVILVDDASPDEGATLLCLNRLKDLYVGHLNIVVIALTKNVGPGVARNAAWEVCTQPYIAFLDSDDAWIPEKIKIQYGWMRNNSSVAITGHSYKRVDGDLVNHIISKLFDPRLVTFFSMLLSNRFQTSSVMLKKSISVRFDEKKRLCEDYQLWIDIILEAESAYFFPVALGKVFRPVFSNGGLSGDLLGMENAELGVFSRLYKKGHLSLLNYSFIVCWSISKFSYRFLVNVFRKFSK